MIRRPRETAVPGIPRPKTESKTMRAELHNELWDKLETAGCILPPRGMLRTEELIECDQGNRSLPMGDQEEYEKFKQLFKTCSSAKTSTFSQANPNTIILNTKISPRQMQIRLSTLLLDNGRAPLPMPGSEDSPKELPSCWLSFAASKFDPGNITGWCWRETDFSHATGKYLPKIGVMMNAVSKKLTDMFGFNAKQSKAYNHYLNLLNLGRIKSRNIYHYNTRFKSKLQVRNESDAHEDDYAYHLEGFLSSFATVAMYNYKLNTGKVLEEAEYFIEVGCAMKLLTEYSAADVLVPFKRLKLLKRFAERVNLDIDQAYADISGSVLFLKLVPEDILDHLDYPEEGNRAIRQSFSKAEELLKHIIQPQLSKKLKPVRIDLIKVLDNLEEENIKNGQLIAEYNTIKSGKKAELLNAEKDFELRLLMAKHGLVRQEDVINEQRRLQGLPN